MSNSKSLTCSLLVLVAVVFATSTATGYNVDNLVTYQVSQLKAKTINAGLEHETTIGNNNKHACSRFAVGLFSLLGLDEDLRRDGFAIDAAKLFDELALWASKGKKDSFKTTYVPLFKACSNTLVPKLEQILVPQLPESKWDLEKLERYTLSNAMKATANNANNHYKRCVGFADRIFANYNEVYSPNDPKLIELSLELSLQLVKHFEPSTSPSQVITNTKALAQRCSYVFADVLKKQNADLTKSQVADQTESLIRLVYPEWRPKED